MLAAALAYADRGWPVFPVRVDKTPLTAHGFHDATTDRELVKFYWRQHPTAGVGIATGATAGIVVLDEDTPKGGARGRIQLEQRLGKLPPTYEVLSGGGGRHYYFAHPGGTVPCSVGELGTGLDVRGDGGYIVAAGSPHQSGRPYKLLHERELAPWPAALSDRVRKTKAASLPAAEIPEGERNATLTSLAGALRRKGGTEAELLAAITAANERCAVPLAGAELAAIAASVARYAPHEVPRDENLAPFALELATARSFCAQPDADAGQELLGAWVVKGYRVIVGGHTGEGKTTLALAVARAIVTGDDLLGFTGAGSGRVLILDAEQGVKSLRRRLREAGLDERDDVDVVRVPDGLQLDKDERHVAELERVLDAGSYDLVVADPLYKLHSGDSNAEREATDLMRRLDGWREHHQFALLLPVHCRKPIPGLKFSIHDIFGSSAYVRGAEVVVGIQRLRDGYSKLHWLKDRDGDLPISASWGVLFSRTEGFRRDPSDGKRETTADKMRALLEQDPTLSNAQLVAALNVTERTVRRARGELEHGDQENLLEPDQDE
jgi:hypothetical protein